jgi:hypothetical protein
MRPDELDEKEEDHFELVSYREVTSREKQIVRRYTKRLAKLLNTIVVLDEDLDSMFGKSADKYYRPYPKFGERAWLRPGKDFDIVLWDEGNGWYTILAIIFKSTSLYEWVKNVY